MYQRPRKSAKQNSPALTALLGLAALAVAALPGCAGLLPDFPAGLLGRPGTEALEEGPPAEPAFPRRPERYDVLDYQGKAEGLEIPPWAQAYLTLGHPAAEALFPGNYVFIASNSGGNFRALSQWAEAFSPERDIARLAEARMEARFIERTRRPGVLYGKYFELFVRAASDMVYTGAERLDSFWLKRRFPVPAPIPGDPPGEREGWEFLIIVGIDKSAFEEQVNVMLDAVTAGPRSRYLRDELAAFNKVRENLFEGL